MASSLASALVSSLDYAPILKNKTCFEMKEELHEIAKRIQLLMAHYSPRGDGKTVVADFANKISVGHQVLNRCFKLDSRSGKYPRPSQRVLSAIKKALPNVNTDWLLTGEGQMQRDADSTVVISGQSTSECGSVPVSFVSKLFEERERTVEQMRICNQNTSRLIDIIERKLEGLEQKIENQLSTKPQVQSRG